MKRKFTRLLCTAVLAVSLCGMSAAYAASTPATAQLSPDVVVEIDGIDRTFYNAQGQEVHPILYMGTTYIPLRSIGELMNKNVNWDAATATATIGGTRTTGAVTGTPDNAAKTSSVTIYLRPEITVVIDGTERTFYDYDGKQISPAVYDGSIYLPIRAIGEIMGKTVSWDSATKTVVLRSNESSGGYVTDYDTGNAGATTPPATTVSNPVNTGNGNATSVTLEQAKQIALDHAGKTASQVTFVKAHKDYDNWRWEYEVEFIVASGNGYMEYDYDIDANTGKIISYDYDAEGYAPAASGNNSSARISEETAKSTALARVPGATSANLYKFKLDFDDGRWEYEGEIYYNQMEYEFTIDASTGAIVEWEVDSIYD